MMVEKNKVDELLKTIIAIKKKENGDERIVYLEDCTTQVLDEGDPECKHNYILYIDNAFDGQAWWCDECGRYKRMGYCPGEKIRFPPDAYIRTLNPDYGGEEVYSWRADSDGVVRRTLPLEERISRWTLKSKNKEGRREYIREQLIHESEGEGELYGKKSVQLKLSSFRICNM